MVSCPGLCNSLVYIMFFSFSPYLFMEGSMPTPWLAYTHKTASQNPQGLNIFKNIFLTTDVKFAVFERYLALSISREVLPLWEGLFSGFHKTLIVLYCILLYSVSVYGADAVLPSGRAGLVEHRKHLWVLSDTLTVTPINLQSLQCSECMKYTWRDRWVMCFWMRLCKSVYCVFKRACLFLFGHKCISCVCQQSLCLCPVCVLLMRLQLCGRGVLECFEEVCVFRLAVLSITMVSLFVMAAYTVAVQYLWATHTHAHTDMRHGHIDAIAKAVTWGIHHRVGVIYQVYVCVCWCMCLRVSSAYSA